MSSVNRAAFVRVVPYTKIDVLLLSKTVSGADPGEVKFSTPFFLSSLLSFFFLIPQILIGSITLLQKFTPPPHFKILDQRLGIINR